MRLAVLFLLSLELVLAQSASDRILGALEDRGLAEQVTRLRTDDRISLYDAMVKTKPDNLHYQILLAGAYVQKTRETTDYSYLDRAVAILNTVLSADGTNYEALRLFTETELERHLFAKAAESSRKLIAMHPEDPWNWGTLGDAQVEIGNYEAAAESYQKMVVLRPDLASYNRAAHYRFLFNDVSGAVEIMKKAIDAGSTAPENVAWCMVDLGNIYWKTGQLQLAKEEFAAALRTFRGYHPAYAGLGKTLAETGDWKGAIENYKQAQEITPLPDYAAALYDLYMKTGQDGEAKKQMELVQTIDRISAANQEKANRNLVLIFADHGIRLDRALQLAQAELEFRRDVYTYDALAWALYKNGRLAEAQDAMRKALVLKTPEPGFQHHAELILGALRAEARP